MTTYNRAWLRSQVASQLRDSTLGAVVDDQIDMAVHKVSLVLESDYNEVTKDYNITGSSMEMPNEISVIRGVSYRGDGWTYALRSAATHYLNSTPAAGQPATYTVKGNTLHIQPSADGVYSITFWSRLELDEGESATLDALQAYPFLFREAALAEGYAWKEDAQAAEVFERKYLGAIQEVNRVSRNKRQGDAPAMRSV